MEQFLQEWLMEFLLGAIALAIPAAAEYVRRNLPAVKEQITEFVVENISEEFRAALEFAARLAAQSVEQEILKENLTAAAEELLARAVVKAQEILDELGFPGVSAEVLATAIRAALRQALHKDRPVIEAFEITA